MDRRQFLGSTAATAMIASMPVGVRAVPPKVVPKSWVVGTPGEYDWVHCWGATEHDAKLDWLVAHVGESECENGHVVPGEDCECEVCYGYRGIELNRVEAWDGKPNGEISPGDWMRAGLGHICSRCSYECGPDDGRGVGKEAVCDDCMTIADWEIVDPERAADMRAELQD